MSDNAHGEGRAGALDPAKAYVLNELIQYAENSIVSRTVVDADQGTLTLFAFDEGQGLSEHSTPFDAFVVVLDGEAELTIGGRQVKAGAGEMVLMPADVPHAVRAPARFKMMLVMIRG